MVATKLTGLSAFTPILTDIVYGVDDPGGTPISGKLTLTAIRDLLQANLTSVTIGSDVKLERDAANTLALRNSTNAQAFNVYNTYTDASNYELASIRWNSNVIEMGAFAAGTGSSDRSTKIFHGNSSKVSFGVNNFHSVVIENNGVFMRSTGHLTWANSSNAGATGVALDTRLTRVGAGIVGLRNPASGVGAVLNFQEQTAPSAPSANQVHIYAEDNGAGKTRLMALFPTGAAQQIAIEP